MKISGTDSQNLAVIFYYNLICNAANGKARGAETFCYEKGSDACKLSGFIQSQVYEAQHEMEYITSGKPVDDYTTELDQTVKKLQNDDGSEALYMTWEQTILEERENAKAEGEAKGRAEGKTDTLKNLVKKGLISISVAAKEAGMTEEAFKKIACL